MLPVCPVCDVGLLMLRFAGVEVDYCDRCRGIWLDAGELDALAGPDVAERWQSLVAGDGEMSDRLCPRCDQAMERVQHAGVSLDRCRLGHGWWFDQDELSHLLAQPVAEKLRELFGPNRSPA